MFDIFPPVHPQAGTTPLAAACGAAGPEAGGAIECAGGAVANGPQEGSTPAGTTPVSEEAPAISSGDKAIGSAV